MPRVLDLKWKTESKNNENENEVMNKKRKKMDMDMDEDIDLNYNTGEPLAKKQKLMNVECKKKQSNDSRGNVNESVHPKIKAKNGQIHTDWKTMTEDKKKEIFNNEIDINDKIKFQLPKQSSWNTGIVKEISNKHISVLIQNGKRLRSKLRKINYNIKWKKLNTTNKSRDIKDFIMTVSESVSNKILNWVQHSNNMSRISLNQNNLRCNDIIIYRSLMSINDQWVQAYTNFKVKYLYMPH